ncbi:MAG: bacteriohemerythrin [Bryobacteraceae bacterium]|nr:bacteriohemerythrin [Bryobacteraceae bacterium]
MAFIAWKTDYETALPQVDQEHRKLVDMVNRLHAAMVAGKVKEEIQIVLNDLLAYAGQHFGNEERLMQRSSFPGYAQHKQQHDEFATKVRDFVEQHNRGRSSVSVQLLQFLGKWLVEHIQNSDKRLASHVRGRVERGSPLHQFASR